MVCIKCVKGPEEYPLILLGDIREVLMTEMVLLVWILYSGGKTRKWKVVWKEILKYFFWDSNYLSWLRESVCPPLFQHHHFSSHAKRNLETPLIFLLSGVNITNVAPSYQGVGILHIGENNKIVSIFTIFLRDKSYSK